MTATQRAAEVTWNLTGQKKTLMPLRLGLAHFCFDYSHKQANLSELSTISSRRVREPKYLGNRNSSNLQCPLLSSRADFSHTQIQYHGIIEFLLLYAVHLRWIYLCICYGLSSKFSSSLLTLGFTVYINPFFKPPFEKKKPKNPKKSRC